MLHTCVTYTTVQKYGVSKYGVFCSPMLYLFDQNTVKTEIL